MRLTLAAVRKEILTCRWCGVTCRRADILLGGHKGIGGIQRIFSWSRDSFNSDGRNLHGKIR
jgi:hypothetical protein